MGPFIQTLQKENLSDASPPAARARAPSACPPRIDRTALSSPPPTLVSRPIGPLRTRHSSNSLRIPSALAAPEQVVPRPLAQPARLAVFSRQINKAIPDMGHFAARPSVKDNRTAQAQRETGLAMNGAEGSSSRAAEDELIGREGTRMENGITGMGAGGSSIGMTDLGGVSARTKDKASVEQARAAPSQGSPVNVQQNSPSSSSRRSSSNAALSNSFLSAASFFSACSTHLQATHGINAWQYKQDSNSATANCSKRKSDCCPWQAVVERADSRRWDLSISRSRLTHNHGASQRSTTRRGDGPDDWRLSSRCKTIKILVASRSTILEEQRLLGGDEKEQQQLDDLAQQYVDSFKTPAITDSPIASSFDLWKRFCAQQDVPAFPISSDLVALCIWKLSVKHKLDFYPFVIAMEKLRMVTAGKVNAENVETKAESLLESDAITEFLDERRQKLSGVDGTVGGLLRFRLCPQSLPVLLSRSSTPSQQLRASSMTDQAPVIPNAPKIGDRFASAEDLVEQYRRTVVPILGVGLSLSPDAVSRRFARCNKGRNGSNPCLYRIYLDSDEDAGDWVIATSSHLKYNHGPRPQILANPNWRPPYYPRRKRGKQQTTTTDEQIDADEEEDPDAGHASVPEPAPLPPAPILAPAIKRSAPSIALSSVVKKPRSDQNLTLVLTEASAGFSAPKQGCFGQPRLWAPVPTLASPARPTLVSRFSLPPSTRITQSPSHDVSPFLPTLAVFLTSLLPSLASAAAPLFDAGVQDVSSLVAFVGLSDDVREVLLKGTQVPLVQRHLLMSKLKQAKVIGWKVV